ncbi:MAG: hypothetical protein ACPLYD_14950 [Anaerolineae bacterium]
MAAGSSPARVTCPALQREEITLVTWAFTPDWLTVEEAAELSGHDPEVIRE